MNLKRCKQFEQHMQSNRLIKRLGCDAKSHPLTPTPYAVRLSQHCSNKFTTQLGNPDDVAPKNSTASPTSVKIFCRQTDDSSWLRAGLYIVQWHICTRACWMRIVPCGLALVLHDTHTVHAIVCASPGWLDPPGCTNGRWQAKAP